MSLPKRASSRSVNRGEKVPTSKLGELLRHWRDARGHSQLDLALIAGISQRHISFVESGRSVPSRTMLLDIAQALDMPLRERNALLLAGGYAPVYSEAAWNALEMKSINTVLERMLRQHEPFPAVVMDRYWNVLMTNASTPKFFGRFIDMSARKGPRNILHLMFDPDGMRPFIANWNDASSGLIQRIYRESVGTLIDDKTRELLAGLLAYPDVKTDWKPLDDLGAMPDLPMIPLRFVKDGRVLSYFSMVTTVGTPLTVAAQELRIESMFPADDETEAYHIEWMRDGES